jgi:hypothetical protein
MKNIVIVAFVLLAISFTACKKQDANKDVESSVKSLELFNKKFADFYSDGVISRDTLEGEDKSEYDHVKKLATQYYESVNKINKNIKEEKEKAEKGKKIDNYEENYQKALEEYKDRIDKSSQEFMLNLEKIQE